MANRRVFVIWTNPLFCDLVRLLLRHPDIEWVGATSDRAAVRTQIINLKPDTVLLEEADDQNVAAEVLRILEANALTDRVIQLSLAENDMTIYHREHKTVTHPEDLLRLIQEQ